MPLVIQLAKPMNKLPLLLAIFRALFRSRSASHRLRLSPRILRVHSTMFLFPRSRFVSSSVPRVPYIGEWLAPPVGGLLVLLLVGLGKAGRSTVFGRRQNEGFGECAFLCSVPLSCSLAGERSREWPRHARTPSEVAFGLNSQ